MEPDQIKLNDWQRIIMGQAPPEFLLELVFRTVVVFFLLVISLRLMGKRMSSRLTRIETTALFVLAAATGVPLPSPDRGLIPGVVIAIVVILVGRLIARWAFNNPRFERSVVDDYATLVKDGVLQMHEMKNTSICTQRLFSLLREKKVIHLGQIERVYFEANGSLSVLFKKEPKPGLAVLPREDGEFIREQERTNENVCGICGSSETVESNKGTRCANCGQQDRMEAVR
jgi:uncharacterized membrane protein YcaP (DUF421 family)